MNPVKKEYLVLRELRKTSLNSARVTGYLYVFLIIGKKNLMEVCTIPNQCKIYVNAIIEIVHVFKTSNVAIFLHIINHWKPINVYFTNSEYQDEMYCMSLYQNLKLLIDCELTTEKKTV